MGDPLSPSERLRAGLAARDLPTAEKASRELSRLSVTDALALLMLLQAEHDDRFERAAVKWLGQLLTEKPRLGLEFAAEVIEALGDINGAQPEVGRSRLAFLLHAVDFSGPAQVLEGA